MTEPRQWLEAIRERTAHAVSIEEMCDSDADNVYELLAEVDRLRAALTALGRNEQAAANRALALQEENDDYRAAICFETTCTGCARLLNQVARLEAERDDWKDNATDTLRMLERRLCGGVSGTPTADCPDEFCPGWKDSGICPNDLQHRY